MGESKLCEICKKKLANVSLWKKDRMVRMCIDCYKDDGLEQLKEIK